MLRNKWYRSATEDRAIGYGTFLLGIDLSWTS